MDKKYLPSKNFIVRVLILLIGVILVLIIYEAISYFRGGSSKVLRTPIKLQVKDVVQKDSNVNGIPDWEESLWGLDPNTNGPSNKEFILAKQKALAEQSGTTVTTINNAPATDNEALSREFFAVIMSLEQTGNLDADAMKSVSEAIGKKIVAEPIDDTYTRDKAIISNSDSASIEKYYSSLRSVFLKYEDKNIGDELSFVATALKNNDAGALELVNSIAEAYRSFGKDLMKISVPSDMLSAHLDLANNYDKVAQSINSLTRLATDPIIGMKGIINYKRYSEALVSNIENMSDNL